MISGTPNISSGRSQLRFGFVSTMVSVVLSCSTVSATGASLGAFSILGSASAICGLFVLVGLGKIGSDRLERCDEFVALPGVQPVKRAFDHFRGDMLELFEHRARLVGQEDA